MKFCDDASETPYINLAVIGESEDDFWSSIVPALDVGIDGLIFEATGAKVNNLDT